MLVFIPYEKRFCDVVVYKQLKGSPARSFQKAIVQIMVLTAILLGAILALSLGKEMQESVVSYTQAFIAKLFTEETIKWQMLAWNCMKRGLVLGVCIFCAMRLKIIWPAAFFFVWYFGCAGFVVVALISSLGLPGAKIAIAMLFPQCILYKVLMGMTLQKKDDIGTYGMRRLNYDKIRQIIKMILVVVMILFSECYVNLCIMKIFLKNYFT